MWWDILNKITFKNKISIIITKVTKAILRIYSKILRETAMLWTNIILIKYLRIKKELNNEVRLWLRREEHNRLINIKEKVKELRQNNLLYRVENMIIIKSKLIKKDIYRRWKGKLREAIYKR